MKIWLILLCAAFVLKSTQLHADNIPQDIRMQVNNNVTQYAAILKKQVEEAAIQYANMLKNYIDQEGKNYVNSITEDSKNAHQEKNISDIPTAPTPQPVIPAPVTKENNQPQVQPDNSITGKIKNRFSNLAHSAKGLAKDKFGGLASSTGGKIKNKASDIASSASGKISSIAQEKGSSLLSSAGSSVSNRLKSLSGSLGGIFG